MADTELLINCANRQVLERPLELPRLEIAEDALQQLEVRRRQALARLQIRALDDEVVADLLTVLGLGPP